MTGILPKIPRDISVMNMLIWRKKKTRQRIRIYLINESLIDSDDKDINYQIPVEDKNIKYHQKNLIMLDYLIIQLKHFNKNGRKT